MKINKEAAQAFISRVPFNVLNFSLNDTTAVKDTVCYAVMPDSLYTVSSNEVTIANAGVFSTSDLLLISKPLH